MNLWYQVWYQYIMISYIYDIRHDNDHDNAHDIITHPPAMSAGKSQSFGWGIMKDFNVSIPSSIGELGRCLAAEVWKSCMASALLRRCPAGGRWHMTSAAPPPGPPAWWGLILPRRPTRPAPGDALASQPQRRQRRRRSAARRRPGRTGRTRCTPRGPSWSGTGRLNEGENDNGVRMRCAWCGITKSDIEKI
jgi:hypothetical protein